MHKDTFPMSPDAWFRHTRMLSLEQRGLLAALIAHHVEVGPLPDDIKVLARPLGVDPRVINRLWDDQLQKAFDVLVNESAEVSRG